ncbi:MULTISPECIES: YkyB family protein [Listeria]|uniref:YkyB family protein n=1 Tax=Listeria TaxID=1637 RepID=UPI000B594AA4|nr:MULTISPECIES: YkyB family protein [Listeria]
MNQTKQIAEAIFIVNRHSKVATNPAYLYKLKQAAITKLLSDGHAEKVGLQYSKNPKNCRQHSLVLVKCGDFLFHIPPTKNDLKELHHLGEQVRLQYKTKTSLSLKRAKYCLEAYTNIKPDTATQPTIFENSSPYFR